ncbi:glycopeptide resistance protein VanZ-F [Brevibacillus laterosporus]|uniref:glycopeptide resistance protein VanZ-F n=1 Tax=Brevibacillus laterosporus TaxID=1465 RepID=UPI001443A0EB|nr:glycopeptide resistance protein VanZ-F [Brevibacillus laterosporus]NKQ20208.1 glycopeptide resistance protein VanZ-F [Brevibacillus laterosporus]WNX29123.1 glycopeptide resistance protein VanZ-F [Brevibacillus laterosporus]
MLTVTVLYTYFCTIIFCIVFQIGFLLKAQKKLSIKHFLWVYVFLFYLALVYMVTGIGNIWVIGRYGTLIRISEINLLPFSSEGITTYILNIILFMPLGFLLPTIWPQFRTIKNTACTGFFFSLAIELRQLLNHRITDIDDLLMNTLGAIIGYLLCRALFKMIYKRGEKKLDNKSSLVIQYEAIFYLVCSFIGMMLLYYPFLFRKII